MNTASTKYLKHLVSVAAFLFAGLWSVEAGAGAAATGSVIRVDVYASGGTSQQGIAIFYLSTTHTGAPSCHTEGNRWAIDLGVESGRTILSLVTAAHLSGNQIQVLWGTNNCNIYGDTESALYTIVW